MILYHTEPDSPVIEISVEGENGAALTSISVANS